MKLVVPVADMHAGAPGGLVTPSHMWPTTGRAGRGAWGKIQREAFERYREIIDSVLTDHGRPDIVLCMGDMVDGLNRHEAGVGQVVTDPAVQAEIAAELTAMWHAGAYVPVRGTPYHTGGDVDYEALYVEYLRQMVDAEVYPLMNTRYLEVEDRLLVAKHHTGASSVPYGFATPLAKEWMANLLISLQDGEGGSVPTGDLFVHAHTHSFARVGSWANGRTWDSITVPALMVSATHMDISKYSRRLGKRPVHWGVVALVVNGESVTCEPYISGIEKARAEVITVV